MACGGFQPAFVHGEDNDLILRLLQLGEIVTVDQPLFGYRRHGGNVSGALLAGRTGSLRMLQVQVWGAEAHGDEALRDALRENRRRFSRNAGRATAHDLLAAVRRRRSGSRSCISGVGGAAQRTAIRGRSSCNGRRLGRAPVVGSCLRSASMRTCWPRTELPRGEHPGLLRPRRPRRRVVRRCRSTSWTGTPLPSAVPSRWISSSIATEDAPSRQGTTRAPTGSDGE